MRNAQGQSPVAMLLLWLRRAPGWLENQLEKERDQLPLFVPVGLGCGIALWFLTARPGLWVALIAGCLGLAAFLHLFGQGRRMASAVGYFSLFVALGASVIWIRSEWVGAPVLERPTIAHFHARIIERERLPARERVRLVLDTEEQQDLPKFVRVNVREDAAEDGLRPGAVILLRARLMPPAGPALPGAYEFSRRAWFERLGATGTALGPIRIVHQAPGQDRLSDFRERLSAHVQARMEGAAGAIGATLATGDRGAIAEADAEAMRRSGLAHLLSISGLHVTAIVGATYLLVIRLLALFPGLALRWRLPIVAAGTAALAAIGYTLMTGAQVPTIRACVAALLVLVGLALGREAITLRMVAAGAVIVLLMWPEALFGPSFQLSFAAVTAIVALHEHPRIAALLARREEGWGAKLGRGLLALFLTGLAVEIALMPIALFHFHKAGIFGAIANIVAIPLTTFVIMPLLALSLLLDLVGAGAPIWWLCEQALSSLVALAHFVSNLPGAVTMLPSMDYAIFALILGGGIWFCLWRARWRWVGVVPVATGLVALALSPVPDLYVTSDGRHMAVRSDDAELALLRNRVGDFAASTLLENAGVDGEPQRLEDWPGSECTADSCVITIMRGGQQWTILATRSSHFIDALALAAACQHVDIVVSDRWLPRSCQPRWLRLDRKTLSEHGGVTIDLDNGHVRTVRQQVGTHRWTQFAD